MEKPYPNELTTLRSAEMTNEQNQRQELEKRSRYIQIVCSLVANASILSTGMGLGYPAVVIESLIKDQGFTDDQISWFASINAFVAPIGGILSATILDLLGRKKTLIIINILSIISWGLIYTSSSTDLSQMFWQSMLARFLIGIVTGLSSSPAAIYSAEIANPKLRGRLASLTSLAIALGILIIYILGYFLPNDWRLIALISAIICCVTLLMVFFIPESPTWLLSRGEADEAQKSLARIRGVKTRHSSINMDIVKAEIEQMQNRIIASRSQTSLRPSIWKILTSPQVVKPLLIINAFFAFQQLTGTFVIVVYATKFVESTTPDVDKFFITVLIGASRVVATIILAFFILDRYGRKPPTIFSGIGMASSMLLLSAYGAYGEHLPLRNFMTVFLLLTYIVTSTFGFLTIPFTMIAELFSMQVKGLAAGISVSFCYFTSFVSIKMYPFLAESLGSSTVFLIYGIISILATVFVFIILPETKGKTLEEIENLFKSRSERRSSSEVKETNA